MSRLRTVEATTPHGSVEYDVVSCSNCGTEVVPSEAVIVGIGRETYRCDGLPFCRAEHERPRERRALCEYCAEEMLEYPYGADGLGDRVREFAAENSAVGVGLWLGTVLTIAVGTSVLLLRAVGLL